jgi:hypothetical protein
MEEQLKGRIFQDDHFVFTDFNGQKLEKIIVCENPETKNVCMVFVKVEHHTWHDFFLDFGFAVWQNYGENVEDDSYDYIDKTADFGLLNSIIKEIYCEPIENHCQIVIVFEGEKRLVLQPKDAKDPDSESELML